MKTLWLHGMSGRPKQWEHQIFLDNDLEPHALNLNYSISPAFEILSEYIHQHGIELLVGYSHGGFFSYWLSEEFGIPCLLFNPHLSIRSKRFTTPPITHRISPLTMIVLGSDDELVDSDRTQFFIRDEKDEYPDKNVKIITLDGVGHRIDPYNFDKYIKWALKEYSLL